MFFFIFHSLRSTLFQIFQLAPLRPRPAAPSKPGVRFSDEQPAYDGRVGHQDKTTDPAGLQQTPTQILSQVQGEIGFAQNPPPSSVMGMVVKAKEAGRNGHGISCFESGTHSLDLGLFGHIYSPPPKPIQPTACNCLTQIKQNAQVSERSHAGGLGQPNYNYQVQELTFPTTFPSKGMHFPSNSAVRPQCQQGLMPDTCYCSESSTLPRKSSHHRPTTVCEVSASVRPHRLESGTRGHLSHASTTSLAKFTSISELRSLEESRLLDQATSHPSEVLGRVSSLKPTAQASPTYVNTLIEA